MSMQYVQYSTCKYDIGDLTDLALQRNGLDPRSAHTVAESSITAS
jgi:hypothetical protein